MFNSYFIVLLIFDSFIFCHLCILYYVFGSLICLFVLLSDPFYVPNLYRPYTERRPASDTFIEFVL